MEDKVAIPYFQKLPKQKTEVKQKITLAQWHNCEEESSYNQ